MNVNEFVGAFKGGGSRATLFRIEVSNPVDATADQALSFMAESASVPGSEVHSIPLHYMGRQFNFAGHRTVGPNWNVNIIADEDHKIRNALEAWNNYINSYQGNVRKFATSNPLEYKTTAKVFKLDKAGGVLREYQFFGVWPQSVGQEDLDWGNDNIIKFQVNFAVDWFEVVGGVTGNAGGV